MISANVSSGSLKSFVNYHRLSGEQYRILALKGPAGGRRCVKKAQKRVR